MGLLDFYGYPLVAQDLALFDSTYGYPAPPSFTVSPIGPYNPNLGSALGWDGEIDLDVQVLPRDGARGEHQSSTQRTARSPSRRRWPRIVQDGKANVVSQSFGIPEWEYYEAGPTLLPVQLGLR